MRRGYRRWGLKQQIAASDAERGGLHRVRDGYNLLPLHLARAFTQRDGQLRLATVVTRVRWRPDGVELRASSPHGGPLPAMRARAALVTVPLGVLQARPPAPGAIAFDPPLPAAKRAAIARLAMGTVVKLVVRFPGPAGRGAVRGGAAGFELPACGGGAGADLVALRARRPRVSGRLGRGARGEERLAAPPRPVRTHPQPAARRARGGLLARALRIPASALRTAVEDACTFDWAANPYARGAYSWIPVGATASPAALSAPLAGCLFFAGEAARY